MKSISYILVVLHALAITASCSCGTESGRGNVSEANGKGLCRYAEYFEIAEAKDEGGVCGYCIITVSPYGGKRDTVRLHKPIERIVCLSSTHVACLAEIGADSVVCAVSGMRYLSNPSVRRRYAMTENSQLQNGANPVYDIGYDNSLDYERILLLKPDLVTAYSVSAAEPQHVAKLRSLGVPVLLLHDHLEEHPLARAEYIRLFGALAGRAEIADSMFLSIRDRYLSLVCDKPGYRKKVMLNVPYADAWYIPGGDNYMSRLIHDAGGEVLGAARGTGKSGVISIEKAYSLSQQADLWLNPGHCRSRKELSDMQQLFPAFGPLARALPIYNNTLRMTPGGGNDFWESGAVRPDIVLEDLCHIMSGSHDGKLQYFLSLD